MLFQFICDSLPKFPSSPPPTFIQQWCRPENKINFQWPEKQNLNAILVSKIIFAQVVTTGNIFQKFVQILTIELNHPIENFFKTQSYLLI